MHNVYGQFRETRSKPKWVSSLGYLRSVWVVLSITTFELLGLIDDGSYLPPLTERDLWRLHPHHIPRQISDIWGGDVEWWLSGKWPKELVRGLLCHWFISGMISFNFSCLRTSIPYHIGLWNPRKENVLVVLRKWVLRPFFEIPKKKKKQA